MSGVSAPLEWEDADVKRRQHRPVQSMHALNRGEPMFNDGKDLTDVVPRGGA